MKTRTLKQIIKDEWLVNRVRDANVLHVGCTDWPLTAERLRNGRLLHQKMCASSKHCVGIDLDGDGIRELKKLMPDHEFHEINAESIPESSVICNQKWDIIVAGDVVEHMDNPGMFFRTARRLLNHEGTLIVTVPSSFSAKRFFWLSLTGIEQVHPDHTAYFSEATLTQIANRSGFKIVEIYGFQWTNPTFKNRFSNLLCMPFLWLSGGRCADEVAVVLKPV